MRIVLEVGYPYTMLNTLVPVSNLYRVVCASYVGHMQVSAVHLYQETE